MKPVKPPLTTLRIAAAFAVAVIADAIQVGINSAFFTGVFSIPAEAADVVVDLIAMMATGLLVGFHIALLPTFLLEVVPGVDVLPTWTACVALVVWSRKNEDRRLLPPESSPPLPAPTNEPLPQADTSENEE